MKKLLLLTGILFILMTGLANAAVNIDSATLGPATAYTETDLAVNLTCNGNGSLTAYWDVFNGATKMDSLGGSTSVTDGVLESITSIIPNSGTIKGDKWNVTVWCGNATYNSTPVTTNTITIQNTFPVASSVVISPTTGTTATLFTCTGSYSDADYDDGLDTITEKYKFLRDTVVIHGWDTINTYQCTTANCPEGSQIKCQYKVDDGSVNSNEVESSAITITTPSTSVSISDVSLGGSAQDKSNPDEDETITTSASVTVTNTGTNSLSDIRISNLNIPGKYNVSFSSTTISSLAAGASSSVTLTAIVPEDIDSFDPDANNPQDNRVMDIGDIRVDATDGTNNISDTGDVTMETENMLEIYRLYVSIDGDNEKVDDDDEIDKISPGAKIEVRLIAENSYSKSSNVDMEEIEFFIKIDEGDVDEEEEESIADIDAGDDREEATLDFTLDDDVDEDTYVMYVTLQGEDSYGAIHGEEWEIELTVEREDKEISITSVSLSPETVSCSRSATLSLKIENTGNDDSDEIVLLVENDALGIYSKTINIDLDDGDDLSKIVPITLGDSVAAGTYTIRVTTFFDDDDYDDNDISSYKSVDLVVKKCETSGSPSIPDTSGDDTSGSDEPEDEGGDVIVVTPETGGSDTNMDTTPTQGGAVAKEPIAIKTNISDNTYLTLIILAYIVAIGLAIVLVVKVMGKKR